MIFQKLVNEKDVTIDGKASEKKYEIRLTSFEEYLQREKAALLKSLPAPK
jgi:hypothetical protein